MKGGELFGQTYMQHLDKIFGPGPLGKNVNAASYRILQDTDERLVAVYAYPFNPGSDTAIDFVVIDKKTGWMHQGLAQLVII